MIDINHENIRIYNMSLGIQKEDPGLIVAYAPYSNVSEVYKLEGLSGNTIAIIASFLGCFGYQKATLHEVARLRNCLVPQQQEVIYRLRNKIDTYIINYII